MTPRPNATLCALRPCLPSNHRARVGLHADRIGVIVHVVFGHRSPITSRTGGRTVKATDLIALVETYQRTFNERDLDAWAQLLDPEIEIEMEIDHHHAPWIA